ncbi:tetratricopeptide repeat protein [Bradyrhizobium sp. URHD0069]|uniref:tetratricopeptide repeat protein n=1 Tax=Bradyrhizobium sp. URHD0069 TaxID=1380355 RepID=UPI00049636A0|nr:tetratricopeptide repeat protein [Bradyrhizobium sp. URHD0069]
MAFEDLYGLPISTSSDAAADAYREGIELMLSAWPGASQALELSIEAEPDFALAHAARSRMHLIYAEMPSAQEKAAVARKLVERNGTEREKSHVEILALTTEGRSAKALEMTLVHLDRWPRDALIMSLPLGAFGLFAFSGMADHDQARVDLCERHARHCGEDWWFLTYLGWSHTENGSLDIGRRITQRAFDRRRENAHALHALAHAMFEDGSTADAEQLIAGWLPIYDRSGLLYGHVAWHEALLALENGDTDKAFNVYAERIQPKVTQAAPLNAMTDGVSLLWRLHASGLPVPQDAWRDLADYAERRFPRTGNSFVDVHMAMLAVMTGNWGALEQRLADLQVRRESGRLPAGSVVADICRAAHAFADQSYPECVKILEPASAEVVRIGGSHAQREMLEDTLLIALIKSGEAAKARDLLDRRLHRRPSLRDARWRATMSL